MHKIYTLYFCAGGITIRLNYTFPINITNYSPKMKLFEISPVQSPDMTVTHRIGFPELNQINLGPQLNNHAFFRAFRHEDKIIYITTRVDDPVSIPEDLDLVRTISVFDQSHTTGIIFHANNHLFQRGNLESLFYAGPDQLALSTVLAERHGCYLHSCGMQFETNGFLFVGHSGTGKSTIAKIFKHAGKLLCDDRIILRRWDEGFRIHGTWSHGELTEVSADETPLRAVFFLEQDNLNKIIPLKNKKEITIKLLENLITPITTINWLNNIFALFDNLVDTVPIYTLHFNKSQKIINLINDFSKKL